MTASARLGCLIMAAGNSERFGKNKLTAEFGGKSLLRRALEAVPAELFSAVTVVTQYDEVEELAAQFGFSCIRNPHPERGVSHTVALGTRAMQECDAIVYLVADQPLLSAATVARLVEAWRAQPQCIVGASCKGRRGNPKLFPRCFFAELLQLQGDHGGSAVLRAHPDRYLPVASTQLLTSHLFRCPAKAPDGCVVSRGQKSVDSICPWRKRRYRIMNLAADILHGFFAANL